MATTSPLREPPFHEPGVGRRSGQPVLGDEAHLGASAESAAEQRYLELAERLAYWMDRRYVDPILGFLLPGAGDAIGAGIGLLGVYAAFRMRAHPVVIARMLIHLAVDSLLGSIPILGAVADFFYKAHSRNLALLRERDVRRPRPSDWLTVAAAATLFVGALLLPIVVVGLLAAWLLG
jgi:hypothetical protein